MSAETKQAPMAAQRRLMIDMRGIHKRFYIGQPNELEILKGIDLQVQEGEFLSIVGASGSGKSTLMNIIGALDRPTQGSYFWTASPWGRCRTTCSRRSATVRLGLCSRPST